MSDYIFLITFLELFFLKNKYGLLLSSEKESYFTFKNYFFCYTNNKHLLLIYKSLSCMAADFPFMITYIFLYHCFW